MEVNPDSAGVTQSTLTIPENLTIEFEIRRMFLASTQEATFRVYNLAPRTRALLQKDPYVINENKWAIQFRAGYKDTALSLCFNGWVQSATSERVSQTDIVTTINCFDGGLAMANSFSAQTLVAGTTVKQALTVLAENLLRTSGKPIIGDFPGSFSRGRVLFGNTWSLLLQESGNLAIIDNGQVKILNPNEAITAGIPLVNSANGLLGSPKRTPTSLEFDMLFEPRLTLGQILQLESTVLPAYNGAYRVSGLEHRGVISPAVAGDCKTRVFLFFGTEEFKLVSGASVQ